MWYGVPTLAGSIDCTVEISSRLRNQLISGSQPVRNSRPNSAWKSSCSRVRFARPSPVATWPGRVCASGLL